MWHPRREQKHLALTNINALGLTFLIDNIDVHIALQLVKKLFALFPVIVLAAVGATHHHNNKIIVIHVDLLVSDGRFEQVAVVFDPLVKVEWS